MKDIFKWLTGVAGVAAVLIFFWPTPYRYEDGGLTRVNRLTGRVQKAGGEGWIDASSGEAEKADTLTPEIAKALDQVTIGAQDFDSIAAKNPGPWSLVLIEKAEVEFDSCGHASDYVQFLTADRQLDAGFEKVIHLSYSDQFRKQVVSVCGSGAHKRSVTLILNSAVNADGRRWDAGSRVVTRKIEADVTVPAS